ncbi:MAG TPA: phenylphosphate carboxylase subunit delta [Thermoanaerobaculia bacterium]|jgi:3-deoxy-D-manno-octulosonate 8-phosphate phosphatase (KDO 8-P phosphatase)|nr:phenylphosphate carboxylase subunit delta [Thermoanaerobaculia bacterium]
MPALPDDQLAQRAARLSWLLFDVDGVMTDGRLFYDADGEQLKVFEVRDGLGLKLAQRAGLKVGILTGRESKALSVRAKELGVDAVLMDRSDKGPAFLQFLDRNGVAADRVGYLGDDLVDLPVITRCGLSFAPADAVLEVRERVDRVLTRKGGRGVAREMIEVVLRARGDWDRVVAPFFA